MNNLSWFLYGAGVASNIQQMLVFISILTTAAMGFWSMHQYIDNGKTHAFKYLIVPLMLLVLSTAIPSKETIYLIAGSEAGEAVVTSQEGQKIIKDIQDVISAQLENLKKSD